MVGVSPGQEFSSDGIRFFFCRKHVSFEDDISFEDEMDCILRGVDS